MSDLPPPPLTNDVDLRHFKRMKIDVQHLANSEFAITSDGELFKVTIILLLKSWHQVPAGSLPSDDRVLAVLSGGGRRWKRLKREALREWTLCSDGRWYHPQVVEAALEAKRLSDKQRGNASGPRGRQSCPYKFGDIGARDGAKDHDMEESMAKPSPNDGGTKRGVREEKKGEEKNNNPPSPLPPDLSVEVWKDFTQHRKAKRAPLTNTVINRIAEQLELARAAGWSPDAALTEVMNAGWTGLNAEWLENRRGSKSSVPRQHTPKTRSDQRADFLAACMAPAQPGRLIEGVADDNG